MVRSVLGRLVFGSLLLACGGCLPVAKGCIGVVLAADREGSEPASGGPVAEPAADEPAPQGGPVARLDDEPAPAEEPAGALGEGEDPSAAASADAPAEGPGEDVDPGSGAPGAPGAAGRGSSFTCNAQGFYMKCPKGGYCMSNLAMSNGVGRTREQASSMAEAMCNRHMTNLVSIHNFGGRAYVSARCRTIKCTGG